MDFCLFVRCLFIFFLFIYLFFYNSVIYRECTLFYVGMDLLLHGRVVCTLFIDHVGKNADILSHVKVSERKIKEQSFIT